MFDDQIRNFLKYQKNCVDPKCVDKYNLYEDVMSRIFNQDKEYNSNLQNKPYQIRDNEPFFGYLTDYIGSDKSLFLYIDDIKYLDDSRYWEYLVKFIDNFLWKNDDENIKYIKIYCQEQ